MNFLGRNICFSLFCLIHTGIANEIGAIDSLHLVPKSSFQLLQFESKNNSIRFVTCSDYVYHPFGKLKGKVDFPVAGLNSFDTKTTIGSEDALIFETDSLKFKKKPSQFLLR